MKKKQITQSDDLIAQGVAKKLIRIGDDGKRIEYLRHGISRDWTKPEAIVEAKAYLTLVLQYEYPDDRIQLFAPVTVGSSLREADIEVFADAKHESPIIIVECKKVEVTEAEFRQAGCRKGRVMSGRHLGSRTSITKSPTRSPRRVKRSRTFRVLGRCTFQSTAMASMAASVSTGRRPLR